MPYSSLREFAFFGFQRTTFEGDETAALACLRAAQATMHGYFRSAEIDVPIPDTSVDESIKEHECWLAAYPYMCGRGFDPNGADSVLYENYKNAIAWCKDVAAKRVIVVPVVGGVEQDADTTRDGAGAAVVSEAPRGWRV